MRRRIAPPIADVFAAFVVGLTAWLAAPALAASVDGATEARASDAAALEILERAIVAQGGRAIGGPVRDVKITAEVEVYDKDSKIVIDTVQMMLFDGARKKFRSETKLIDEDPSIRATDGSIRWQKKGPSVVQLDRRSYAQDLEELERDIDFLETCVRAFALENLKGDGVRFELLGEVAHAGLSATKIRRIPPPPPSDAPKGTAASALDRPLVLFIEAGTHRLLGVELEEGGDDTPRRNICFWERVREVSIGGRRDATLALPRIIKLFTRDRLETETYLTGVEINSGIDDSLFAKPR